MGQKNVDRRDKNRWTEMTQRWMLKVRFYDTVGTKARKKNKKERPE